MDQPSLRHDCRASWSLVRAAGGVRHHALLSPPASVAGSFGYLDPDRWSRAAAARRMMLGRCGARDGSFPTYHVVYLCSSSSMVKLCIAGNGRVLLGTLHGGPLYVCQSQGPAVDPPRHKWQQGILHVLNNKRNLFVNFFLNGCNFARRI